MAQSIDDTEGKQRRGNIDALRWVPSAWLAMGLAYAFVTGSAAVLLRDLGLSMSEAVVSVSLLGIPYVIKPLYAPLIELNRNKRFFVVLAQLGLALGFAASALVASTAPNWLVLLLVLLATVSVVGSVQDIACEGLFLTELDRRQQATFTSVQSITWNGAALIGGGALIALSGGHGITHLGVTFGWASALMLCAVLYGAAAFWHRAHMPLGANARNREVRSERPTKILLGFFRRPHIVPSAALCIGFPISAGLVEKIEPFFLIDTPANGGFGLSREALGGLYATAGFAGLTIGAALGSVLLLRRDLPRSMLLMGIATLVPASIYLILSLLEPVAWVAAAAVFVVARAALAFGMVGYVVYLQRALAPGAYPTSHYNLASGLKALTMVLAGMASGPLQQIFGYRGTFVCALICGAPMLLLCRRRIIAETTRTMPEPLPNA